MKKTMLLLSMVLCVVAAVFLLWPHRSAAPTVSAPNGALGTLAASPRPDGGQPPLEPVLGASGEVIAASGAVTGPRSDAEWKKILTPKQFDVIRQDGTEAPFSSPLDFEKRPGTYVSADCGIPLFRSEQKYDSGTGWPSFWAPISPDVLTLKADNSMLLGERVEVRDAKCDGHLGHVFDDGPPPTGKRYCMNGVALRFIPDPPK